MKKLFFATVLMFGFQALALLDDQGNVIQDRVRVECTGDQGQIKFNLNRSTQVAVFDNKTAMWRAELPLNEPIMAKIEGKEIHVTYNWEFLAQYIFTFAEDINSLQKGDSIKMRLDGDDDDGVFFNEVPFQCLVKGA